jgi:hypothetical protein
MLGALLAGFTARWLHETVLVTETVVVIEEDEVRI